MIHFSTYVGHLRYSGAVGPVLEYRRVVVDVLHANDERGRGLQGTARLTVSRRGNKSILVLLLTVQRLGYMNVARAAVNHEDGAGPFPFQGVPGAAVTLVHTRVKLCRWTQWGRGRNQKEREGEKKEREKVRGDRK